MLINVDFVGSDIDRYLATTQPPLILCPLTSLIKLLHLRSHLFDLFDLGLLLAGHSLDILRHVKLLQILVVVALASEVKGKRG